LGEVGVNGKICMVGLHMLNLEMRVQSEHKKCWNTKQCMQNIIVEITGILEPEKS
jgi:hypothetical protein